MIAFLTVEYLAQLGDMCWILTAFVLQSSWLALSKTIPDAEGKEAIP
jgi:hypothetical protein